MSQLDTLIAELETSATATDLPGRLRNSLDSLGSRPGSGEERSSAEAIRIDVNSAGGIEKATTQRIGHVRFRLFEFLTEGAGGIISAATAHPGIAAFFALRFLHKVLGMTKIQINERDAQMLVGLHKLQQAEMELTIEALKEATGLEWTLPETNAALEKLEALGCISRVDEEIRFNESITIREKALAA